MTRGTATSRMAETNQMRQPSMVLNFRTAKRLPATSIERAMVAAPRDFKPERRVSFAIASHAGISGQANRSRAATTARLKSRVRKGGLSRDFRLVALAFGAGEEHDAEGP